MIVSNKHALNCIGHSKLSALDTYHLHKNTNYSKTDTKRKYKIVSERKTSGCQRCLGFRNFFWGEWVNINTQFGRKSEDGCLEEEISCG